MRVVVAIIQNERGEYLITQRGSQSSFAGFWEFPGGKVESQEKDIDALERELYEELGITNISADFFQEVIDNTRAQPVYLQFFKVNKYNGTPQCLAGQLELAWSEKEHLLRRKFPPANEKILALL